MEWQNHFAITTQMLKSTWFVCLCPFMQLLSAKTQHSQHVWYQCIHRHAHNTNWVTIKAIQTDADKGIPPIANPLDCNNKESPRSANHFWKSMVWVNISTWSFRFFAGCTCLRIQSLLICEKPLWWKMALQGHAPMVSKSLRLVR